MSITSNYITEVLFQDRKLQYLSRPHHARVNTRTVDNGQLSLEYKECVTLLLVTSAVTVLGLEGCRIETCGTYNWSPQFRFQTGNCDSFSIYRN